MARWLDGSFLPRYDNDMPRSGWRLNLLILCFILVILVCFSVSTVCSRSIFKFCPYDFYIFSRVHTL